MSLGQQAQCIISTTKQLKAMNQTHKCGVCEKVFGSEQEYLDHVCEKSGSKPTEIEHLVKTTTPNFEKVAEAALKRGEEKQ